jgi:hypothetical protein
MNKEKLLANKGNNLVKLINNTKRWYEYRKYYTDKITWFTYLSDSIKESSILNKKFITLKSKWLCKSIEQYNIQFL